jgi:hypothetical protein
VVKVKIIAKNLIALFLCLGPDVHRNFIDMAPSYLGVDSNALKPRETLLKNML